MRTAARNAASAAAEKSVGTSVSVKDVADFAGHWIGIEIVGRIPLLLNLGGGIALAPLSSLRIFISVSLVDFC